MKIDANRTRKIFYCLITSHNMKILLLLEKKIWKFLFFKDQNAKLFITRTKKKRIFYMCSDMRYLFH